MEEIINFMANKIKDTDKVLFALQENNKDYVFIKKQGDLDHVLTKVIEFSVEENYCEFDGDQYACIEYYRNLLNSKLDKMEEDLNNA